MNRIQPYDIVTDGAEMEQGIYSIQFHLFENGDDSIDSKNLDGFVKTCKTDFIYDETYDIYDEYTYKAYKLLSGSIWTFMLRMNPETLDCEIVYGKDSEENTVSILWLIPQYSIITFGEVLNIATAGEFVYTQVVFHSFYRN